MSLAVTGSELAALGDELERRATARDRPGLGREVARLLEALEDHIVLTGPDIRRLPRFTARLVERGQERLLEELLVLAVEVGTGHDAARCQEMAGEIAARLALQTEHERRALARLPPLDRTSEDV